MQTAEKGSRGKTDVEGKEMKREVEGIGKSAKVHSSRGELQPGQAKGRAKGVAGTHTQGQVIGEVGGRRVRRQAGKTGMKAGRVAAGRQRGAAMTLLRPLLLGAAMPCRHAMPGVPVPSPVLQVPLSVRKAPGHATTSRKGGGSRPSPCPVPTNPPKNACHSRQFSAGRKKIVEVKLQAKRAGGRGGQAGRQGMGWGR